MIRSVQLNISDANTTKLQKLDILFEESKKVINLYIDQLWSDSKFHGKFVKSKVDTWLSARMQQCLGKQAFEIVKSQRKRKKKTKPVFTKNSLNLDERFVDFQFDNNSFDIWIRLASIGNRIQVKLPARKHKHFLHYKSWPLKKSIRLRKIKDSYFIDVYFEKQVPSVKAEGTNI